jgi:hypothetical protein
MEASCVPSLYCFYCNGIRLLRITQRARSVAAVPRSHSCHYSNFLFHRVCTHMCPHPHQQGPKCIDLDNTVADSAALITVRATGPPTHATTFAAPAAAAAVSTCRQQVVRRYIVFTVGQVQRRGGQYRCSSANNQRYALPLPVAGTFNTAPMSVIAATVSGAWTYNYFYFKPPASGLPSCLCL